MKKLLALGLSLAMMASLTAVAFAADNDGDGVITKPDTSDIVKVYTVLDEEHLDDYETYKVEIDAEVPIEWGNYDPNTLKCDVTGRLLDGSTLTVTAEKTTDMTNDAGKTITYSLTKNDNEATPITSADIKMTTPVSRAASVAVDANQFEQQGLVPGAYNGQVTFTVNFQSAAV